MQRVALALVLLFEVAREPPTCYNFLWFRDLVALLESNARPGLLRQLWCRHCPRHDIHPAGLIS